MQHVLHSIILDWILYFTQCVDRSFVVLQDNRMCMRNSLIHFFLNTHSLEMVPDEKYHTHIRASFRSIFIHLFVSFLLFVSDKFNQHFAIIKDKLFVSFKNAVITMCNECFRVPQLAITEYSICILQIYRNNLISNRLGENICFSIVIVIVFGNVCLWHEREKERWGRDWQKPFSFLDSNVQINKIPTNAPFAVMMNNIVFMSNSILTKLPG